MVMLTFLSAINKLTRVHAFSSNEQLLLQSVFVGVSELNLSKRGATARVMDDILYNTLDVTLALCEVQGAVLSRTLPGGVV